MRKNKIKSLMKLLKEEVRLLVESEDLDDEGLDVDSDTTDFTDLHEEDLQSLSDEYSQKLIEAKEKLADEAYQKLIDKTLTIETPDGSTNITITKAYWGMDDILVFSGESIDEDGHLSLHTL
jgi:translation initiation factor 2B subunit (eIF-2B alpha/beta/delta family)